MRPQRPPKGLLPLLTTYALTATAQSMTESLFVESALPKDYSKKPFGKETDQSFTTLEKRPAVF